MERIKVLKMGRTLYLRIPSKFLYFTNVNERSVFRFTGEMEKGGMTLIYRRGIG